MPQAAAHGRKGATTMWIYHQLSGRLEKNGKTEGPEGYSGHGLHVNDVFAQAVPNVGPIPRGLYEISNRGIKPDSKLIGPVLKLTPVGHDAERRTGLRGHGDYTDRKS